MLNLISAFAISTLLCWGSFLNALAYRLVHTNIPLTAQRSHCPHCQHQLAWYDLIPLLSYLQLRGHCRYCHTPISPLYLLIEAGTVLVLYPIFTNFAPQYWLSYFLLFSALLINIRTDLETYLLSLYTTLYLVPVGWLLAFLGYAPVSLIASLLGAGLGYGLLWGVNRLYHWYSGRQGLGVGDGYLLAAIGAFTGPVSVWFSLMIGAFLGSLYGLTLLTTRRHTLTSILPFGPCLAAGAIIFSYWQAYLLSYLI